MKERRYLLQILVLLVGLLFVGKLFFIQVMDSTYRQAAESNFTQRVKERAYRGRILDRNGKLLVYNVPVYDIYAIPKEVKTLDTARFCSLFDIDAQVLEQRLQAAHSYSPIKSSHILGPLYEEEFARVQSYIRDFAGFHVQAQTIRGYKYPYLAHVLGYLSEIDKKQLIGDTSNYYQIGDLKGRSGIEAYYEEQLRGKPSLRYKMVDARGREIGAFAGGKYDTLSVPGKDLTLGIDINLQAYAEQLMVGRSGSIVALEPSTGEILCFVSAPSYAPHILSGRHFRKNYSVLATDSLRPLFVRPLQAMYRPGSIFKIAQALVALQEKAIHPESKFSCNRRLVGCHFHNPVEDLIGSIRDSCNPYFYRVMQRVVEPESVENPYQQVRHGLQRWNERMLSLGFGTELAIDVPFVQNGAIPSPQDYDKIYGTLRWRYSNIYSLSIGEGENLVVPLQMANLAAIVANGGYYYVPHFVRSVGDSKIPLPIYTQRQYVSIHVDHFTVIQKAMQQVVTKGTGWRAQVPEMSVCGKTGSVQNQERAEHSVFIAFAPQENPKIAVSVYVEYAGEGGTIAAAISGLLIEKYLKGEEAALFMEPYVFSFQPPQDDYTR